MILDQVSLKNKRLCPREELLPVIESLRPEVLLTIGAGDIDQLCEPITRLLEGYVA